MNSFVPTSRRVGVRRSSFPVSVSLPRRSPRVPQCPKGEGIATNESWGLEFTLGGENVAYDLKDGPRHTVTTVTSGSSSGLTTPLPQGRDRGEEDPRAEGNPMTWMALKSRRSCFTRPLRTDQVGYRWHSRTSTFHDTFNISQDVFHWQWW